MEIRKLELLLQATKRIADHQEQLLQARGDTFNLFSILGMETRENETHSAFLAELLSPVGSHMLGSALLTKFIALLPNHTSLKGIELDTESAVVTTEYSVGKRDDQAKTGGRIDIWISDKNGKSISIENKIHASDQFAQIERYAKHNPGHNTVLFLTLDGHEPSKDSKGNLGEGQDYFNISYSDFVLDWLEQCKGTAADVPFVRENIRQYQLLLQKLTGTMDDTHNKELTSLLLQHYDEAAYIASSFNKITSDFTENIRRDVYRRLKESLGEEFKITLGSKTTNQYAQIWIELKEFRNASMCFGIESFSGRGHYNGNLFVGVYSNVSAPDFETPKGYTRASRWWPVVHKLEPIDGYEANLGNPDTLVKLHEDEGYRAVFCSAIAGEVVNFVKDLKPTVEAYL